MADIVNLRRARKARRRDERAAAAEVNRQAFGRTKADRKAAALRTAMAERVLDGHRLEPPGDDG